MMFGKESERMEIERLYSDFAWHADRGEAEALAGLFTADGVLDMGGQQLRGRQRIADDVARRTQVAGRKTRHVWSNLRITSDEGSKVTATAIQLTFEHKDGEAAAQLRVNDLYDTLRKEHDGNWRFEHRTIQREMALSFAGERV